MFSNTVALFFVVKVPFQDALDLVRTRKVYLKAGYVYIPQQDVVTIVLNDFRTRLSKALAVSVLNSPVLGKGNSFDVLLCCRSAVPNLFSTRDQFHVKTLSTNKR